MDTRPASQPCGLLFGADPDPTQHPRPSPGASGLPTAATGRQQRTVGPGAAGPRVGARWEVAWQAFPASSVQARGGPWWAAVGNAALYPAFGAWDGGPGFSSVAPQDAAQSEGQQPSPCRAPCAPARPPGGPPAGGTGAARGLGTLPRPAAHLRRVWLPCLGGGAGRPGSGPVAGPSDPAGVPGAGTGAGRAEAGWAGCLQSWPCVHPARCAAPAPAGQGAHPLPGVCPVALSVCYKAGPGADTGEEGKGPGGACGAGRGPAGLADAWPFRGDGGGAGEPGGGRPAREAEAPAAAPGAVPVAAAGVAARHPHQVAGGLAGGRAGGRPRALTAALSCRGKCSVTLLNETESLKSYLEREVRRPRAGRRVSPPRPREQGLPPAPPRGRVHLRMLVSEGGRSRDRRGARGTSPSPPHTHTLSPARGTA